MRLTVGQKKRARRAALTYYDTMQPDGYADRWDYMEHQWCVFVEGRNETQMDVVNRVQSDGSRSGDDARRLDDRG